MLCSPRCVASGGQRAVGKGHTTCPTIVHADAYLSDLRDDYAFARLFPCAYSTRLLVRSLPGPSRRSSRSPRRFVPDPIELAIPFLWTPVISFLCIFANFYYHDRERPFLSSFRPVTRPLRRALPAFTTTRPRSPRVSTKTFQTLEQQ